MNYRFISDSMYVVGGGFDCEKNPDIENGVTVTNVQPERGNMFVGKQWTYEYNGKKYITAYSWALIEETEENIALFNQRKELHRLKSELDSKIQNLSNQMKFVK